uniref:Large ribosomal subunit protein uL23m n=1 Tax=Alexandrium monilatum TaxID=311494 RepID=A0A7S4T4P1_9DINO
MFASRFLLGPPKSPRNVFFPWFNFVMVKSGTYLEPNRVAFRVPVHLTKPEIRNYLREVYDIKVIKVNTYIKLPMIRRNAYGDYFKNGPQYKKAIVTCEEKIPDDVKMIYSSRFPWLQPALTKYDTPNIRKWKPFRPGMNRKADWAPRHPLAWAEPIPTLLRGDDFPPPVRSESVLPDHTKPFEHYGRAKAIPPGTPPQEFPRIDIAMLRADKEARSRADRDGRSLIELPEPREGESR